MYILDANNNQLNTTPIRLPPLEFSIALLFTLWFASVYSVAISGLLLAAFNSSNHFVKSCMGSAMYNLNTRIGDTLTFYHYNFGLDMYNNFSTGRKLINDHNLSDDPLSILSNLSTIYVIARFTIGLDFLFRSTNEDYWRQFFYDRMPFLASTTCFDCVKLYTMGASNKPVNNHNPCCTRQENVPKPTK